jgi:hypothetical protein
LCKENEYKEEKTIHERTLPIHKESEEEDEEKEGSEVEEKGIANKHKT